VTRHRRPSAQTIAVLQALAAEPARWRYGYDLCTQLGMRAGSMYPILIRLANRGLLDTDRETDRVPGRQVIAGNTVKTVATVPVVPPRPAWRYPRVLAVRERTQVGGSAC
jgi:hypothetical protein